MNERVVRKALRDTPMVQRNRYFCYTIRKKYCVGYFYRGSTCQFTKEFSNESDRLEFIKTELSGFVPIG